MKTAKVQMVHVKKVTIPVEITVIVNDNVEPKDITFDITLGYVIPKINGKSVGRTTGYKTGEPF